MSDTGELIVYKIICWKIISMEIKGGGVLEHPEHPHGYAPGHTCRYCEMAIEVEMCPSRGLLTIFFFFFSTWRNIYRLYVDHSTKFTVVA